MAMNREAPDEPPPVNGHSVGDVFGGVRLCRQLDAPVGVAAKMLVVEARCENDVEVRAGCHFGHQPDIAPNVVRTGIEQGRESGALQFRDLVDADSRHFPKGGGLDERVALPPGEAGDKVFMHQCLPQERYTNSASRSVHVHEISPSVLRSCF